MHPFTLARDLTRQQGHQNALGQKDTRAQIRNGDADPHRALSGNAGNRHQAAHALGNLVHSRAIPIRTALPKARDDAVDDAGVDWAQALVIDTQTLFHARAVILHDDVSILRQALKNGHGLRISEVQRDALFVTVQVLEIKPVAIAAHAITIAPTGHFDLDGLRTPIDQLPHTRRASPSTRQVKNFETSQWQ